MASILSSLAGHYLGVIDDADSLSWDHRADLDVWQEQSSDSGQPGQWLVKFNDRKYAEPPVRPLTLSGAEDERVKLSVEGGLPHWITRARVQIQAEAFVDEAGEVTLNMRQYGQGMTAQETWDLTLRKATDDVEDTQGRVAESNPVYDEFVRCILHDYSAPNSLPRKPRIDAFTIVKNGKTLFEKYLRGMTPATVHIISSCTKSVTSLLAGIALGQGLFALDDRIVDYFPGIPSTWGDDPPILVRHVLSMTAGTELTPEASADLLESTDIEQLILGAKRVAEPGAKYCYDNAMPSLVGSLIERRSGIPLEDFAERHFFSPLGIRDYVWTRMTKQSRSGVTDSPVLATGGMFLSLPSFVKIGQLLLQNGHHDGRQIVPEWYIFEATSQQTIPSDYPYGFYFHLNDLGGVGKGPGEGQHLDGVDGYFALGQGQQILFVSPKAGLVVAAFSSIWHREVTSEPSSWGVIFGCMNDAVVESSK